MIRRLGTVATALAVAGIVTSYSFAGGQEKAAAAMAKPAEKGWYMVVCPHTDADCKAAMGEMEKMPAENFAHMYASCMHGDHTCYSMVQADTADAAKATLPASLAKSAMVKQIDKVSMAMAKAAHPAAAPAGK